MSKKNHRPKTLETYSSCLLAKRYLVLVINVILVVIFAIGLKSLKFSNDYRVFFDKEDPKLHALEEIHSVYADDDPLAFVLTPKDGKVFSRDTLASIEWLTRESWKIPYVQRVDSLQNHQFSRSRDDELVVSDLFRNPQTLNDEQIEAIRQIALSERQLKGRLVNPTGTVAGVFATFHLPGVDRQKEIPDIVEHAEKIKSELIRLNPNLDARLTGGIVMSNAFTEASNRDTATLSPIIFLLITLTLWLLLRSALTTFAALTVIGFTVTGAMGIAGWLGFVISPASAIAPNVLLTVAVADSVHILVDFLNCLRVDNGVRDPRHARFYAIAEALRQTFRPIFLTTLTTAIGFLSLNFSDSPPFRDLGNIVAIGVVVAFALSVFFLPALLAILPIKAGNSEKAPDDHGSFSVLADFLIRHRKTLALLLCPIIVLLGSFIPTNELDDDMIKYFSSQTEFRKNWEYTTANLTGLYPLEFSIRAKGPGGINDPEYLKIVDEFGHWFEQQPETLHVDSIVDLHKRLNKNMHGDDSAWYRLPDNKELAAQYLLLYEMSLPPGLELNDRINIDKSASRFTVVVKHLSSNEMLNLEARAAEWLRSHAPPYMRAEATSPPIMFAHIGHTNIQSMIEGTFIEFAVIAAILMIVLRSFGLGVLSLLPNAIPAVMAFGFWALVNGKINMGLSVVTNMTLGIVVDDTVHFLTNYTYARRNLGASASEAIRYTLRHVGKAMAVSTAVLAVGFGILMLSAFELNAQMGLLTAITIVFALLGDLFLLPSLLLFRTSTRENSRAK